jgi:hypothetical protein
MRLAFCVVAVVLFILAAFPQTQEWRLLPIGLAFLAASLCLPL